MQKYSISTNSIILSAQYMSVRKMCAHIDKLLKLNQINLFFQF